MRLTLSTDGTSGPYLIAPKKQSEELLKYFRANGVSCVLDAHGVGNDSVINFGSGAEVAIIEDLLKRWQG